MPPKPPERDQKPWRGSRRAGHFLGRAARHNPALPYRKTADFSLRIEYNDVNPKQSGVVGATLSAKDFSSEDLAPQGAMKKENHNARP
jgi:hypothetical protein